MNRAGHSGKKIRYAIVALGAFLLLWGGFTWPLPRFFLTAIPSSDRNIEQPAARELIPGDHLQLLYHFWLSREMLSGSIPLFENRYEFNTGNDRIRREPGPYYLPFSFVYAITSPFFGHAGGWNIAGLLSALAGFLFTWRLAGRYASRGPALAAALVACAFPYRWITLLVGSPTGFAMALPPALCLGIDMAVRERKPAGGWMAGAVLFFSWAADLHVFYFSVLLCPVWTWIAWIASPEPRRPDKSAVLSIARALAPALALGAITLLISHLLSTQFEGTALARGRDWAEVIRYSPPTEGLYAWKNLGMGNHVFFGIGLAALWAVSLTASLAGGGRNVAPAGPSLRVSALSLARRRVLAASVTVCLLGIVMLALGANGPLNGALLRLCRKVLPRYDMIRQTVKIYAMAPVFLVLPIAAGLEVLRSHRVRYAAALLLALAAVAEAVAQVSATLCLLPTEMIPYRAIAEHAESSGRESRALVLPLWPGDSHWTSIYQYAALLHRVRLVNGYVAAADSKYIDTVYRPLESLNQGHIRDEQLDLLEAFGTEFLVLHENAFPQQVSPFPVAITLRALNRHPRLRLLRRDGAVWAYEILPKGKNTPDFAHLGSWGPALYAPALVWDAALLATESAPAKASPGALYARTVSLTNDAHVRVATRSPVFLPAGARLLVRNRGISPPSFFIGPNGEKSRPVDAFPLAAGNPGNWRWDVLPLEAVYDRSWTELDLRVSASDPPILIDTVLLSAGEPPPQDGTGRRFAAADLFHTGHTNPEDGSVIFLPERDPDDVVCYGPHLPVSPGRYRLEIEFESAAPAGALLGEVRAGYLDEPLRRFTVRSGREAAAVLDITDNRPLRLEFVFSRRAALRLIAFVLVPAKRNQGD